MSRNVVNKNDLSKYVHDVATMEKHIYTLHEISKRLRRRATEIVNCATEHLTLAQNDLLKSKSELNKTNKEVDRLKNGPANTDNIGMGKWFVLGVLIAIVPVYKLVQLISLWIYGTTDFPTYMALISWVVLAVCGFVACGIREGVAQKIRRKQNAKIAENKNATIVKEQICIVNEKESVISQKTIELNSAKKKAQALISQANLCDSKANELADVLRKSYADVIGDPVPVDFRYLDCVIVLDFVFRNNLADSMKEAVLFYNNQVFQKAVIRGIDNICARLDELTGIMQGLRTDLNDLQFDIHSLSMETNNMISNMASSIETSNAIQSDILSETRATKYATMAVKESVDNYHRYYGY